MAILFIGLALLITEFVWLYQHDVWLNYATGSLDLEKLGQAGDLVGGTLNPLFAYLAFVGVTLTLLLQMEQREEERAAALVAEEAQRDMLHLQRQLIDATRETAEAQAEAARALKRSAEAALLAVRAEVVSGDYARLTRELERAGRVGVFPESEAQMAVDRRHRLAKEIEALVDKIDSVYQE